MYSLNCRFDIEDIAWLAGWFYYWGVDGYWVPTAYKILTYFYLACIRNKYYKSTSAILYKLMIIALKLDITYEQNFIVNVTDSID